MFNSVVQEYSDRRIELKTRISESKKKLAESSGALNNNITKSLNLQVEVLHENQRKVENQCKSLRLESEKLMNQSKNWVNMYATLNGSFKELGDINNWAEILEKEMAEVSAAITKLVSK